VAARIDPSLGISLQLLRSSALDYDGGMPQTPAQPLHPSLALDRGELEAFCIRRGIRRLSLFGSRLTGHDRPDSDIDLLVEFDPRHTPTLLDMADMEHELSLMLDGSRVDLRTPGDLSRYFRGDVVRNAAVQYESG